MKNKIIIATIKSWNIDNAYKFREFYKNKYEVTIFTDKKELNKEIINSINPKWIFFPHWSWIIPLEIYKKYTCVVFHITDLPFGRGGSPLQNLISKKIYETKISALKVTEKLDAGPIYLKENFYIELGSAEEIFIQASEIIFFKMIPFIITKNLIPKKQSGNITIFKRRKPEESDIISTNLSSLSDFYDYIRMLDGEGYPKAFINFGEFKMEFSEVHKKADKIVGKFEIFKKGNKK
ncbi:Methionyl-tRNA formyltransferase [subsurface metagenome]